MVYTKILSSKNVIDIDDNKIDNNVSQAPNHIFYQMNAALVV